MSQQPPPQALRFSHGRGERETSDWWWTARDHGKGRVSPLSPSRLPLRLFSSKERRLGTRQMSQGVQNSISVPLDRCGYNADPLGNLRFPNSSPFGQRSFPPSVRKYFTRFVTLVGSTVNRGVRSAVKVFASLAITNNSSAPCGPTTYSPLVPPEVNFFQGNKLQCRRFLWARNLLEKALCWNFPKRGTISTLPNLPLS